MTPAAKHWTEDDVESFVYRVAFDFVAYVSRLLESGNFRQQDLAARLGVSEGRISQILNSPGNLTLKQMVRIARALGRKVAVVPYDDGDSENRNGPISASVFTACWEVAGKPLDLFEVPSAVTTSSVAVVGVQDSLAKVSAAFLERATIFNRIGSCNADVKLVFELFTPKNSSIADRRRIVSTGTDNQNLRNTLAGDERVFYSG